jgi:hypothetical protein
MYCYNYIFIQHLQPFDKLTPSVGKTRKVDLQQFDKPIWQKKRKNLTKITSPRVNIHAPILVDIGVAKPGERVKKE